MLFVMKSSVDIDSLGCILYCIMISGSLKYFNTYPRFRKKKIIKYNNCLTKVDTCFFLFLALNFSFFMTKIPSWWKLLYDKMELVEFRKISRKLNVQLDINWSFRSLSNRPIQVFEDVESSFLLKMKLKTTRTVNVK